MIPKELESEAYYSKKNNFEIKVEINTESDSPRSSSNYKVKALEENGEIKVSHENDIYRGNNTNCDVIGIDEINKAITQDKDFKEHYGGFKIKKDINPSLCDYKTVNVFLFKF